MVASATNFRDRSPKRGEMAGDAWQKECWHFYDVIGEFEFVANWTGNVLSRAKLHVLKDGKEVEEGDPGAIALSQLYGSPSDQPDMLRAYGVHSTVAGECFIVAYTQGDETVWEIVAPQNLEKAPGGGYKVNGVLVSDSEILIIRIWNRHPFWPKQATAPSRAALPIMAEIEGLTMHVAAQIDSRLTNAGILFLPNEMAVSAASTGSTDSQAGSPSAQGFVNTLTRVMGASRISRDSPEALIPIVVTADGEHLDKPHLLKFWTELDQHALELRSEAIRRLALSLDIPPEVLTGSGDMSHWSAWNVDESAIKSHTEPLLLRFCSDLTSGYLRPAIIEEVGPEEALRYSIAADTSEMRLRPNRSKEAMELADRGLLSNKALLRETGFGVDDLPDTGETANALLYKVASGSATPDMVIQALEQLGVKLEATEGEMRESRPAPSLEDHPERDMPDPEESERRAERRARQAALLAAAEVLVFRAFERVGNKMKNQYKFSIENVEPSESYLFRDCSSDEIDFLMQGALTQVNRFANKYGVDAEGLGSILNEYCRSLIKEKRPHDAGVLAARLKTLEVSSV